MKPTQKQPGYYWNSNDGANLPFNESGPEQPTTVRCYMMDDLSGRGGTIDTQVANLEFMAAGIFGEARGDRIKWTGDSHKYGIYAVRSELSTRHGGIVILECHGGGMVGYAFGGFEDVKTWQHITATSSREQLWDVCHMLANACSTSRNTTATEYKRAIVEKRVKVRRRKGLAYVTIEAAA